MLNHLRRIQKISKGKKENRIGVQAGRIYELRKVLQWIGQVHEIEILVLPLVGSALLPQFDEGGVEGVRGASRAVGGRRLRGDPQRVHDASAEGVAPTRVQLSHSLFALGVVYADELGEREVGFGVRFRFGTHLRGCFPHGIEAHQNLLWKHEFPWENLESMRTHKNEWIACDWLD